MQLLSYIIIKQAPSLQSYTKHQELQGDMSPRRRRRKSHDDVMMTSLEDDMLSNEGLRTL